MGDLTVRKEIVLERSREDAFQLFAEGIGR